MPQHEVGKRELRSFGLIVGAGFAIIGSWPILLRAGAPRTWALILTLLLSSAALAYPWALIWPFRAWVTLGEALGWVNTRLILGLVYYVLIVPIGGILRIAGKDPMRRGFEPDRDTYCIPRGKRAPSHMQRQF